MKTKAQIEAELRLARIAELDAGYRRLANAGRPIKPGTDGAKPKAGAR